MSLISILGIDGKKYPRTTKPVEPKRFGAPDPMEKYLGLQETLDRVIGSSLFGAINDNSVGKHNIARMLKRAGCYAKGFKQAFLWDNRTDLSAEHVSHLEKANGILQEIIIDVEIFTLNHEQNRDKCKIYLNELYTKLTETKESDIDEAKEPEPMAVSKRFFAQIVHYNKDDAPYGNTNELWFATEEQRDGFAAHFRRYHGSHDHNGNAPTIAIVKASELNSGEKDQAKHVYWKKGKCSVDYDGWFGPELRVKTSYFKPTCIIPEEVELEDVKPNGEPQPEPVEETPAPVKETPKASETKVLKIQGMTIYIDNPDSSKSFPTGVHFSEKKSEDFKDHLISDIPSDVLAELERVANEILLNKETEDE